MPELPEMEILAQRLNGALLGKRIETAIATGVNVLRTFDPPLEALGGAEIVAAGRRGKLLTIDVVTPQNERLVLLIHLMTAGRIQLLDKHSSLRDRASRFLLRLDSGQELRMREFGSKQSAWVRLLLKDALSSDDALSDLGPEAWPDPPPLGKRLNAPRPLHALLRDQKVIAGIGRTWVDEILHQAKLSPFKRGNDLDPAEEDELRAAINDELARGIESYEAAIAEVLPEKFPKPTRVHGHQGEPCYRCGTKLEAVFYESYVMTYCPSCQTAGRLLKDRRLSRLLK